MAAIDHDDTCMKNAKTTLHSQGVANKTGIVANT
jgi:hypothetical protein